MAIREIIFRGKRVDNGEWVYSSFIMQDKEHKLLSAEVELFDGENWRAVIPETVGQYTGLNDKNGKKIFEGDIIRTQEYYDRPYSAKAKRKRRIGVIEYAGYQFVDGRSYSCWAWSDFYDCEVIGNIHDNPELLEEIK